MIVGGDREALQFWQLTLPSPGKDQDPCTVLKDLCTPIETRSSPNDISKETYSLEEVGHKVEENTETTKYIYIYIYISIKM